MRRSAAVLLVVALGVFALVAWWRAQATPPQVAPARLAPSFAREPVPEPVRSEPARPPAPSPPKAAEEPGEIVLHVYAVDLESKPASGLDFVVTAYGPKNEVVATAEAFTAWDGSFEFRVPGGRVAEFGVAAKSPGYLVTGGGRIEAPPKAGFVSTTLRVAKPVRARAFIGTEKGDPLPFAHVHWWRGRRGRWEQAKGLADGEGVFMLPLGARKTTISAVTPGFGRGILDVDKPVEHTLVLRPVKPVYGQLVDVDGNPVENARLEIMIGGRTWFDMGRDGPDGIVEEETTTKPDGTFVLRSLTPKWFYDVRVTSDGVALTLEPSHFVAGPDVLFLMEKRK